MSEEKNPDLTISLLSSFESLIYTYEVLITEDFVQENRVISDFYENSDYSDILINLQYSKHSSIYTISKRIIEKYFEHIEMGNDGEMEIEHG